LTLEISFFKKVPWGDLASSAGGVQVFHGVVHEEALLPTLLCSLLPLLEIRAAERGGRGANCPGPPGPEGP
jgi:hypothetical protein